MLMFQILAAVVPAVLVSHSSVSLNSPSFIKDLPAASAITSPITAPPNAPEAQSPDFAAPTAQPSKACETL